MMKRLMLAGLVVLATGVACKDEGGGGFSGEIQFEGEQPFLPGFEQDTGWIPAQSPASVRVIARAEGGLVATARATTDGSSLTPVAGSGELTSSGELLLEVSARIDTAGFEFEDVVDSFSYVIEPATATFEPFLLDGEVTVEADLPASELASVPIPSVPGATLVIDVAGGSLTTAFEGVCAEASEGVGQYTGRTTTTGTINLQGTIEIEIPIVGNESFGPFDLPVEIPALVGEIDLGARSLSTAEPVTSPLPCDEGVADTDSGMSMDSSPPTGGSPTTTPSDPSDSDPSTDSETTPPGMTDASSTGMTTGPSGTGMTTGACTPADECQVDDDCDAGDFCDMDCFCSYNQACDDCLFDAQSDGGACIFELDNCSFNDDCFSLLGCLQGCADQACADGCAAEFPDGVADFVVLEECLLGVDGESGACGGIC